MAVYIAEMLGPRHLAYDDHQRDLAAQRDLLCGAVTPMPPTFLEGVALAFRDHGLTAAITALMGGSLAVAATVTRKAFSNEAVLERLEHELAAERDRFDKQRAEDRKADTDRLERIETDIRAMRDLMFEAFQRSRAD